MKTRNEQHHSATNKGRFRPRKKVTEDDSNATATDEA